MDLLLEEQAATDEAADEEVATAFGPIKPSPSVIKHKKIWMPHGLVCAPYVAENQNKALHTV